VVVPVTHKDIAFLVNSDSSGEFQICRIVGQHVLSLLIKYVEYSHKMHMGIFPGKFFTYTGEGNVEGLALYFSFYYLMTGLHASHVLAGMGLIGWALYRAFKNTVGPHHYKPLEYVGLFWHLVDLIWIYLFPLLYLVE